MYTWLIELTLGLSGVLSTATMALAYGATIAAQLIRLSKKRGGNLDFWNRANLALTHSIESKVLASILI
jgi:hypothetical protein